MSKKKTKKNPLSKAQNELLRCSLKRLLGDGLIKEPDPEKKVSKQDLLEIALDVIFLK
jgi:hypothetical protein